MRQQTITLYSFNELSENIQRRLIHERLENIDEELIMEICLDGFCRGYLESSFDNIEMYYSLFCQGSGFVFDGEFRQSIIDELLCHPQFDKIDKTAFSIEKCGPWNFYTHEYTRKVSYDGHNILDFHNLHLYEPSIESKAIEILDTYRRDACTRLYREIEEYYHANINESVAVDHLRTLGDCFTVQGHIV